MIDLKDKTVLITGATSGIGLACAYKYAELGANLILTGRRLERLQNIRLDIENKFLLPVKIFSFDVSNMIQVRDFDIYLKDEEIAPEIFINNAGLALGLDPIQDGNVADWDTMINTNIKGLLYMIKAVLPNMIKANRGTILNVGSIAGTQVYPKGNVYNATKHAVKAITEAMNMDLLDTNIRVCTIEPGAVQTDFSLVRFKGDQQKADDVYKGFTPLTAEDIANIIVYMTTLPEHINIQSLLVTPTAQRSATLIRKDEKAEYDVFSSFKLPK